MKEIYLEYKNVLKNLMTNKVYIISIIVIAILSYGFTITNFSIGVDDLLQERYVTGTYLLSQGRWGNVLLSRVFNVTNFTPFWADFISTILFIFLTIILCVFIKKQIGEIVNKLIYYIIFSGALMSYPIISNIYIYNFANVVTAVSNIGMILLAIILYENSTKLKNKKVLCVIPFILPFFISMYEASCQTFIMFVFVIVFIDLVKNKKLNKNMYLYVSTCVSSLIIGIAINMLVNVCIFTVLNKIGHLTRDFSSRNTIWFSQNLLTCLSYFNKYVLNVLIHDIQKIRHVSLFFIVSCITIILSIIQSIKNKNKNYVVIMMFIIISNFSITFIQTRVLYRTDSSWSIAIAFMILYIVIYFKRYKKTHEILILLSLVMILYNTKELTNYFYNDYQRYEREKNIAYSIANTILRTCEDPNKPLIYILYNKGDLQGNSINYDNGWSVLAWGIGAFGENGTETTRFINSFGYNFKTATNDEYEEGYNEFMNLENKDEKNFIIELEKYIIVEIVNEPR